MNRKISLPILIALVLLVPAFARAAYQRALQITAADVVDPVNNFILTEADGQKYLIHHKSGCGDVHEGSVLTLVITGDLDGSLDEMWNGDSQHCVVDEAEPITGTLTVIESSAADTYTSVSDNGKPFRIFYSERCKNISNMVGQTVYVRKFGGSQLRTGDKFFLPGAGEMCAISYVESELLPAPKPQPQTGDKKRPTTPTHFRAIPSRNAVYLYWDAAQDESGIAYYVISVSQNHKDDPVAQDPSKKPQDMPGTFKTSTNDAHIRLDGLQADETYYFRIIAVDTAGNASSYWSEEATATTNSAIAQIGLENERLKVSLLQETDTYYLFHWNNLPGAKYSVALEVDGKRAFAVSNWIQNQVYVLKKPERQGKKLKLIVRSLNSRGIEQSDSVQFSF